MKFIAVARASTILMATTALIACKVSEDPKPKSDEQIIQEAVVEDFTQKYRPNDYRVIRPNLTESEIQQSMEVDCADPSSTAPGARDPNLEYMQVFHAMNASDSPGEADCVNETKDTITSVSADELDYARINLPTETMSLSLINSIFSRQPHQVFRMDEAGNSKIKEANLTAYGENVMKNGIEQKSEYWSCNMVGYPKPDTVVDEIRYNFKSTAIEAYLITEVSEGNIECTKFRLQDNADGTSEAHEVTKVSMGQGRKESRTIQSPELINLGSYRCKGTQAYFGSSLILKTGQILHSQVEKALEAPLR